MKLRVAAIVCGLFTFMAGARAATAVFTIDRDQTQITMSGKVLGSDVAEQGAGSLTSHFTGTIKVEVSATTIRFTGGSALDAETNGVWEPKPGGAAGTAPADFGGKVVGTVASAKGAFRNIILDITSESLPLNNGAFDSSALAFGFLPNSGASFDYDLGLLKGSFPLSGISSNRVSNAGQLLTEGGAQKLVMQVDTEYKFRALTANDSSARITGKIVALRMSQPLIKGIGFTGGKVRITVEGTSAASELQSSGDLVDWKPRVSERLTEGADMVFIVEVLNSTEFFRLKQ